MTGLTASNICCGASSFATVPGMRMEQSETNLIVVSLFTSWAHVTAKAMGRKHCRKEGVGAILRELKSGIPENGTGPHVSERRQAAQIVESNCRLCGKCDMSEVIGEPPPEAA